MMHAVDDAKALLGAGVAVGVLGDVGVGVADGDAPGMSDGDGDGVGDWLLHVFRRKRRAASKKRATPASAMGR